MELSRAQQKVLKAASQAGAVQVIAGAGAGKTSTILALVRHLMFSGEKIALLSFSRKSAGEFSERMPELSSHNQVFTGTLHSLAWQSIRENSDLRLRDMEKIRERYRRRILNSLSRQGSLVAPPDLELNITERIEQFKRKRRYTGFDELFALALQYPVPAFPIVIVDEFQDTSPDQLDFILYMRPIRLIVVGDDWQAIYGFRGADVSLSVRFPEILSGAGYQVTRVQLSTNYRSRTPVVRLGNSLIRLSSSYVRKNLRAVRGPGRAPVIFITSGGNHAERFRRFISVYRMRQKQPFTVLVRTNAMRFALQNLYPDLRIMTIHASKGLEFDHVVIYGLAHHVIPHRDGHPDEEIRLTYVAITRARETIAFVAWDRDEAWSAYMPFLARRCKVIYAPPESKLLA